MPYRWEPNAGASGRYRDERGRFVASSTVRRELDRYLDGADPAKALAGALRGRQLSAADWEVAMRRHVKNTHLNAIALERGGWANMTPADYGRAGQIIREQYGYLRGFARDIASGKQRLDGTLGVRAKLYTQAGRETFYRSKQANLQPGIDMVRSIKHARDSCRDCEYLNGKWFKVGDPAYSLPGRRQCNKNCRCTEEYGRQTADGVEAIQEDAAWARETPLGKQKKAEKFFFESEEEIARWVKPPGVIEAEGRLAAKYPQVSWDLKFVDEATARRMEAQFDHLLSKYPLTRGELVRVQSYGTDLGSIAMLDRRTSTMKFSAHYMKNTAALERELEQALLKDWLDADASLESLISHEYGHAIEFGSRSRWDRSSLVIGGIQEREARDLGTLLDRWQRTYKATADLSEYATVNAAEAFAEGFAQMVRLPSEQWTDYTRRLDRLLRALPEIEESAVSSRSAIDYFDATPEQRASGTATWGRILRLLDL
jgi:hypothetical protein